MLGFFKNRFWRELLPFVAYFIAKREIDRELDDAIKKGELSSHTDLQYQRYRGLSAETIDRYLLQEHTRRESLREKTFKFGAGFAAALTIITLATAVIVELPSGNYVRYAFSVVAIMSVIYVGAAGILGFSAFRVERTFGYGPESAVERSRETSGTVRDLAARDLVLQIRVNNITTVQNEAAFACLRNGFLILIFVVVIGLAGATTSLQEASEPDNAERKNETR